MWLYGFGKWEYIYVQQPMTLLSGYSFVGHRTYVDQWYDTLNFMYSVVHP